MSKSVFISYKHEDRERAEKLKKILVEAADHVALEVFLADEDIRGSDDWRSTIKEGLANADFFILLYTGEDMDWGWCLYELGLFTPIDKIDDRKSLCLHPKSISPPSVVDNTQTIGVDASAFPYPRRKSPSKKASVKIINKNKDLRDKFLTPFLKGEFFQDETKLRLQTSQESLGPMVIKIAELFEVKEVKYYQRNIAIEFDNKTLREVKEEVSQLPDRLRIIAVDGNDLSMFGCEDKETTWGDIRKGIVVNGWEAEAVKNIERIKGGKVTEIIEPQLIFKNGKSFQTVSYRMVRANGEPRQLEFLVIPTIDLGRHNSCSVESLLSELRSWSTYSPMCLLKFVFSSMSGGELSEENIEGEATIFWANSYYKRFFGFSDLGGEQLPTPGSNEEWTGTQMINRLYDHKYVEEQYLNEFLKDQKEYYNNVLLKDSIAKATVPLHITDNHPDDRYRGKQFLPVVVFKRVFKHSDGGGEILMLITLVGDFYPLESIDKEG